MPKNIIVEKHYLIYCRGVHNFFKGISPKVNVLARLEFKLAYYDSPVQRFNNFTTRTPHFPIVLVIK